MSFPLPGSTDEASLARINVRPLSDQYIGDYVGTTKYQEMFTAEKYYVEQSWSFAVIPNDADDALINEDFAKLEAAYNEATADVTAEL